MITVIGCGNPARRDDGAGIEAIRRLTGRFGADDEAFRFIDAGTSGMEVMFRMRGATRVVIVDACRSGSEAGAVFRLPASEAMTETAPAYGMHGLRWDHALYAGSKMFGEAFIRGAEVFLIEAQDLDFGIGLSAPVQQGVQRVVDEIAAILRQATDAG